MRGRSLLVFALLFVGANFIINVFPYFHGRVAWFSQIEDHSRLEGKVGVSFRKMELVNTEDPDIQYLANGIQHWLTGTHDYVHHPGTPIVLVNAAIAGILHKTTAPDLTRKEFAARLLREPFTYAILCRMVMALIFAVTVFLMYLFVTRASSSGRGKYGPAVTVLLAGSTLLFHRHWLKESPDMVVAALHMVLFLLLLRSGRNRWAVAAASGVVLVAALVMKMSNLVMVPLVMAALAFMEAEGGGVRGRGWKGIRTLFHPSLPLVAVAALGGAAALFKGLGLFANQNFIDFYASVLSPLDDTREIFYTGEHFDRLYFLKTVVLNQPFLPILGVLSFMAIGRSGQDGRAETRNRVKWVLGVYGAVFFAAALAMRPNYHYLMPAMLASALLAGLAVDEAGSGGLRQAIAVLAALSAVVALAANVTLLADRLAYADSTRIDRESFHHTRWGDNRYLAGFTDSLHDGSGLPVAGHYGFYPYEVVLKRHTTLPLSLPNFSAVVPGPTAAYISSVLENCHSGDVLVATDAAWIELGGRSVLPGHAPCGYDVVEKDGYRLVRPVNQALEPVRTVDFSKGVRVVSRGEGDGGVPFTLTADSTTLGLTVEHRAVAGPGRWLGGYPVALKVFDEPVAVGPDTFLRWTQTDRSEALLLTLLVSTGGDEVTPLTYALNSFTYKEGNKVELGNSTRLHDPGSRYTFQRRLMADLERSAPGSLSGSPPAVVGLTVAHRVFTRLDHHRPDKNIGGAVEDVTFLRAARDVKKALKTP